ncbi:hypothetical protein RJ639_021054 [Escallonia herrerae]|uniref:RecQ-mediated genome instability protein 1 n=1 Tax=Escallonia herrerae TaxID=1293975 RepID=A0AA88V2D8_9ASTE|nr:hypothetical protein RJ639_021054 [Escallonia herrerae]
MEKENAQMEELEESLLAERMNVLQRILNAGLSRWRDHTSAKSQTSNDGKTNTRSSSPIQLEISDDEFINIPDITPPSPPSIPVSSFRPSDYCPISGILGGLGLRLRSEWLDSCVRGLEGLLFTRLDDAAEAKLCFEQFLCSDMNCVGAGVLPENVQDMHLVDLAGTFVLQVDEIVHISCPLKGRYQNAPSTLRCLKLSMTDCVQRVFGMEYRPIKDLEDLAPAGLKVATCNLNVRHELLMLVPEVLGGLVEELEAARQRLVNEVNKPPRGKKYRGTRTGVVPPLAARATLAAWPPDPVSVPGHDNSSMQQPTTSVQADAQGYRSGSNVVHSSDNDFPLAPNTVGTTSGVSTSDRTAEDSAVPMSRVSAEANQSSAGPNPPSAAPVHRECAERNPSSAAPIHREVAEPSPSYAASSDREMDEHNQHNASSSSAILEVDDIHMAEAVEHPSALTGDLGTPFTYLAKMNRQQSVACPPSRRCRPPLRLDGVPWSPSPSLGLHRQFTQPLPIPITVS